MNLVRSVALLACVTFQASQVTLDGAVKAYEDELYKQCGIKIMRTPEGDEIREMRHNNFVWCHSTLQFIVRDRATLVERLLAAHAIDRNITIDLLDLDLETSLHYAVFIGSEDLVRKLLAAWVTVDHKSSAGHTALMSAAMRGNQRIVKLLIAAGASLDIQDNLGKSALMWAVAFGQKAMVELLLNEGANPCIIQNKKDGISRSAVTHAVEVGRHDIAKLIKDAQGEWQARIQKLATAPAGIPVTVTRPVFIDADTLISNCGGSLTIHPCGAVVFGNGMH